MIDRLIIGIDISENRDRSSLSIARERDGEIEIINQFYDQEAENIYYKLTNIHIPQEIKDDRIKEKMIYKTMNELTKYYSYRQILELIEKTKELKDLTNKEIKEKINKYPLKMQEMLTIFWLTHSNNNFFNFFGFNWVPSMELQNEAREIMENSTRWDYKPLEISVEVRKHEENIDAIQKAISKNFYVSKNYLSGAAK